MLIAIYNRNFDDNDLPYIKQFFQLLAAKNINVSLHEDFYHRINAHIKFEQTPPLFIKNSELRPETEFFITLGGDGTMLDAVCLTAYTDIPLLGINLGRLGFLADVPKDNMEKAINSLLHRSYSIERRSLLHLDSNLSLFDDFAFALNDFTIYRKDSSSMVKINTFLNGQFLNTYWSDGLIVSTPTGSTGYSLSCNGPVVFPQSSTFLITPVSPHNLNIRPIIVPDDYVISFEVECRAENFLCTLDSRMATVEKSVQLAVRREDFDVKLVRLDDSNFLDTIRQKLYWGIDSRN